MLEALIQAFLTKETIFLGLFLWLFWTQQQEKKEQNGFLLKQQDILGELSTSLSELGDSFEKMAANQEKLTERIEKIEVIVDKRETRRDG